MPLATGTGVALFAITRDTIVSRWINAPERVMAGLTNRIRSSVELSGLIRGADTATSVLAPYDADAAGALFDILFTADIFPLLNENGTLLVLSNGALNTIPFGALIARQDKSGQTQYLIDLQTIVRLSSLEDLSKGRQRKPRPFKDFIGISSAGNERSIEIASTDRVPRSLPSLSLPPLGEAVNELDSIRATVRPRQARLFLEDDARERNIRELKTSSRTLITFATHGLSDIEINGVTEPALVLTTDQEDDGFLTASEIAALSLPASMVVLSACNSASAGYGLDEGFAGLANAFVQAGAERLLVSHWRVRDDAAAYLTTQTFQRTAKASSTPHALRDAMITLREDESIPNSSHPAVWASFEYVGP